MRQHTSPRHTHRLESSWRSWHTLLVPAPWRQRQAEHEHGVQGQPGLLVSSRAVRATFLKFCLKKQSKTRKPQKNIRVTHCFPGGFCYGYPSREQRWRGEIGEPLLVSHYKFLQHSYQENATGSLLPAAAPWFSPTSVLWLLVLWGSPEPTWVNKPSL